MTLVVVLDVNILATAAALPESVPALLVDEGFGGRYSVAISDRMVWKLDEVLKRPYFATKLDKVRQKAVVRRTRVSSEFVIPDASVSGVTDDEEDDIMLGTAVAAGAAYLVTGDHGLPAVRSYGGVSIVTAREFLTILDAE